MGSDSVCAGNRYFRTFYLCGKYEWIFPDGKTDWIYRHGFCLYRRYNICDREQAEWCRFLWMGKDDYAVNSAVGIQYENIWSNSADL